MRLFQRHEADANAMISITEDGKRAIDRDMVGDIKAYAILAELDQHSPQSLSSLAKQANTNIFTVKREVEKLRRQGMIRMINFRMTEV